MANFNRINLGGVTDTLTVENTIGSIKAGSLVSIGNSTVGTVETTPKQKVDYTHFVVLEAYQEGLGVDDNIPVDRSINLGVITSGSEYAVRSVSDMELTEGQPLFFGAISGVSNTNEGNEEGGLYANTIGYSIYNTSVKAGELVAVRFI